jgi:acetyl esterase/lipase
MFPDRPTPAPDDLMGWKSHVEAANVGLTQASERFAHEHPGTIETHALTACTIYEVTPSTYSERHADKAIYYIHGGGFTVGHGIAAAYAAHTIAGLTGLRTYSVDYRMPPEHPFPAALDDTVEGYRFILGRHKASDVAVNGASAGGGLAGSFVLKARDIGLSLPAACVLMTPEADLTETGDTFETNDTIDVILKHRLTNSVLLYANGHDLKDPYLSPVLADFSRGFPPTLLTSGTRDLFLSNTVRFHRALRRAGIEAELHVWEAMPHGGFFGAPEDKEVYEEQSSFIKRKLRVD